MGKYQQPLKTIILPAILLCLIAGGLGIHLQYLQEPIFYYREQQQVFLWDMDYIQGLLSTIGGTATLLSQILIQFFRLPAMGAVITATIGMTCAGMFWLTLRKIHPALYLLPLSFVPVLFQCLYLESHSYHYEGLVSLLLWSLFLYLYSLLSDWRYRLITACVSLLLLFYMAGSVAMLYGLSVPLLDMLRKQSRWYFALLPLCILCFAGLLTITAGVRPDYDHVFWMKDYVAYYVEITPFFGFSWQSALVLILLAGCGRWLPQPAPRIKGAIGIALIILAGIYYYRIAERYREKDFYTLMQMFHYMDTEQWDEMVKYKELNFNNYLHLNCLNLALSKQGRLQTELFTYPQKGLQSLVSSYHAHIEESILFSQLYHHIGVTALAYNFAFGASVGSTYGNPAMTKLIIQSHLIYGNYLAAEKFISMLEKTWAYDSWATRQRRFLFNDAAVEADPELGKRRRSLTDNKDLFANIIGLFDNLSLILEHNPQNKEAADYMISALLLSKEIPLIKRFVEEQYGTALLPKLPPLLQQAVITYAEHDPHYCRAHGVSEEALNEFIRFKQQVLRLRHAHQDLASGLANYRHTFWYYYLIVK